MNSIDKNWVDNHIDSNGEVIIPAGVEKIEAEAFRDNELVQKVIMSDTVIEIGDNAFTGCLNLQDIKFSNNIKVIGEDAFLDCKKVTSIELPKSIEIIKEEAFARCESLEKFLIDQEAKISEIQDTAFYQCKNLSEIILPVTIKSIGEYTFVECEKLNESIFTYLSQLTTIKEGAFSGCQSIKSIEFPDTIDFIGKAAFYQCSNLENVTFSANSKVKRIEEQTFQACEKLKTIQLSESIEEIGMLSYAGCTNLTDIAFGKNTRIIGERAFCECESLQKIVMPDSLQEIALGAFYKCTQLNSIDLGKGLEEIGMGAFSNCKSLKSISLPESLKKIGVEAFIDCSELTNIERGTNIEQIEVGAFENTNIKTFRVPPKVKIFDPILCECANLEELYIGENTEELSPVALKGCSNLKKLVIDGNITYFPETTLEGCDNLEEVELNGTSHIAYGSFQGKDSIRKITIDGKEILLDESEKLFSLQQHDSKIAIVVKDKDGLLRTRCINTEKDKETKQDVNIYLANDGSVVRACNSIADISLEQLRILQSRGEKSLYLFGAIRDLKPEEAKKGMEYDLYNIEDLIQVKLLVEDMKKEITVPSKEDKHREKKIYSQLVRKLSEKLEYDFFEEYNNCKTAEEKEAEERKYEKITGKSWNEYLKDNENRDLHEMQLEDGNLIGLLRGRAVCRGNVEIIRNLAAEFGIEATAIIGQGHTWNQVKLDGVWYDDDFTNYQTYLSRGELDKSFKRFLGGQIDGKSEFSSIETYEKTLNSVHSVGKTFSTKDKSFLLNYGREKQQTIQELEKRQEQEQSIKDEVGDELKPKTQEQQQNEQEAEAKWMNSFQACDQVVAKMQNGAKKKQEVVQLIQNLEQERKQEQNRQIQEENENQVQGR